MHGYHDHCSAMKKKFFYGIKGKFTPEAWRVVGPLMNEIFERVAMDPQVVPPAANLLSFDVEAGGESRRLHGVI